MAVAYQEKSNHWLQFQLLQSKVGSHNKTTSWLQMWLQLQIYRLLRPNMQQKSQLKNCKTENKELYIRPRLITIKNRVASKKYKSTSLVRPNRASFILQNRLTCSTILVFSKIKNTRLYLNCQKIHPWEAVQCKTLLKLMKRVKNWHTLVTTKVRLSRKDRWSGTATKRYRKCPIRTLKFYSLSKTKTP